MEKGWEMSLKPGDKVIGLRSEYQQGVFVYKPSCILTVKKVTPTGIIRTDGGSYKQNIYAKKTTVEKYGDEYPYHKAERIEEYTEEKAAKARVYQALKKQERKEQEKIREAKNICRELCKNEIRMSIEQARKIIEIFDI